VLVEPGLVEQRYKAVLEVLEGAEAVLDEYHIPLVTGRS